MVSARNRVAYSRGASLELPAMTGRIVPHSPTKASILRFGQTDRTIGPCPIDAVDPAELLAVLKKINMAGKRETAVPTRAFASRVCRHGGTMACMIRQQCVAARQV
ncbi:MAG: phage integrase central domain-containing protein [Blastomonas fulva]|uniref:phage integrase central domain-containing protein n=1 Tax=Blastomonas fulva TaxID=1550728 RepID=UPI0040342940